MAVATPGSCTPSAAPSVASGSRVRGQPLTQEAAGSGGFQTEECHGDRVPWSKLLLRGIIIYGCVYRLRRPCCCARVFLVRALLCWVPVMALCLFWKLPCRDDIGSSLNRLYVRSSFPQSGAEIHANTAPKAIMLHTFQVQLIPQGPVRVPTWNERPTTKCRMIL